jgi:hypothetical protein
MKYIKLFEAFQSIILSKTLGYLDKESKSKFLDHVKKICGEVDFPLSKLSDDYFQYLPFRKALEIIEPENEGLIWKYWLNTDGKLIEISKTDGKKSNPTAEENDILKVDNIYYDRDEYLKYVNPKSGDWIWFKKYSSAEWRLGKVFRRPFEDEDHDDFIWFLNTYHDGSKPRGEDEFGNNWSDYGYKYSWGLYDDDFYAISKGIAKEKDDKIDYKVYNKVDNKSIGDIDSQFAIVFRFDKLTGTEYKTGSKIKGERDESKSGSTALMDNEEIRKKNIEKRLLELSKKELNLDNFDSLFRKTLFDKQILFFDKSMILNNIDKIFKTFEGGESDYDGDEYTNMLQNWYGTLISGSKLKDDVVNFFGNQTGSHNLKSKKTLKHFGKLDGFQSNSIFLVLKKLYDFKTDLLSREMKKGPNTKNLSNKLEELGQLIINKIKPNKFNDIDDVVISIEKLKSIYAILSNNRYDFNGRWDSIIYWSKGLSTDDIDETTLKNYIKSIDIMMKLVSKL